MGPPSWRKSVGFAILTLLIMPEITSGVRTHYMKNYYLPDEMVPEIVLKYILVTQRKCMIFANYDEDIREKDKVQTNTWLAYYSPFFIRNDRMLDFDGKHRRLQIPIRADILVISKVIPVVLYLIFPIYYLLSILGFLFFSIPPTYAFHDMWHYAFHKEHREFWRNLDVKLEKHVREMEILFTPDHGKITRLYRMIFFLRRTESDSEPEELEIWDKEMLLRTERIKPRIPMMIKYAYFFKRKNLWLDPETNMIVPRPEPERPFDVTFDELTHMQEETQMWEDRLTEVTEERQKFSAARRLVYNIPKARFYAIQQGLPYVKDINRREIMLQVKRARRAKKTKEALEAGLPDPYPPKPETDHLDDSHWLTSRQVIGKKKKRSRRKPRIKLPDFEPDDPVIVRKDRYAPTKFDPTVPGGGLVPEAKLKQIYEKRREKERERMERLKPKKKESFFEEEVEEEPVKYENPHKHLRRYNAPELYERPEQVHLEKYRRKPEVESEDSEDEDFDLEDESDNENEDEDEQETDDNKVEDEKKEDGKTEDGKKVDGKKEGKDEYKYDYKGWT